MDTNSQILGVHYISGLLMIFFIKITSKAVSKNATEIFCCSKMSLSETSKNHAFAAYFAANSSPTPTPAECIGDIPPSPHLTSAAWERPKLGDLWVGCVGEVRKLFLEFLPSLLLRYISCSLPRLHFGRIGHYCPWLPPPC